jgi:UV DNA damage endonuclease
VGVPGTGQKTIKQQSATEEKLLQVIGHNLEALDRILDYNLEQDIRLFRISSDLIPFGSSPVNPLAWWEVFEERFLALGDKIRQENLRVSMHPGQYTVLNSNREDVVARAVEDLVYHTRVLDSMGLDQTHKIILHTGGIYGDKTEAAQRFVENYQQLDPSIRRRLVLENDDKSYGVEDVLHISKATGVPVVFDNLHHAVKPSVTQKTEVEWIKECRKTWKPQDGDQKIHYSQQDPGKKSGSHSSSIRIREFMRFYEDLAMEGLDVRKGLDVMLEVKDKNLSAVKCIACTKEEKRIRKLEEEWSRYKYSVLESAPAIYQEIRELLVDKKAYPAVEFYELLEKSMEEEASKGNAINAMQHVWGYFKDTASKKEKEKFLKMIDQFTSGKISEKSIKNFLKRLAEEQEQAYLLNSYYLQNI